MLTRVCFSLALFAAMPAWAQLEVTPFEMNTPSSDQTQMVTPPPVSGEGYPTTVGSQARSNYLDAGFIANLAYDDNVILGGSTTPIRDGVYSISGTVAFNQTTPRELLTLSYSPGFTFYQNTRALNALDQTASANFQYRLGPHTSISVNDAFEKSSNALNQLNPLSEETLSATTQYTPADVVAPYANRISNAANAGLSYQFSKNGMIGAGGVLTENSYPDPTQASNFYNSNSRGGSVFYSQRLTHTQYVGLSYQYSESGSNPVNSQADPASTATEVHTHTIVAFYTVYLSPTLSVSFSGGPQYFSATQSSSVQAGSWTPSIAASVGWQRSHTNLVGSYTRTVSGGGGLLGAFDSNIVNASARWQLARRWTVGAAGNYTVIKNVAPSLSSSSVGGHTISGTAQVQHSLGEHIVAGIGYARLDQRYDGISALSETPGSDRVYFSLSCQFSRPLGR
jgi:hypothetical protein